MSPTKSSTGRTSRALGLAWQAQLDAYHAHLRVTRAGLRVHRGVARLIALDQVRVERAETARGDRE
jgi:hypothetical protein